MSINTAGQQYLVDRLRAGLHQLSTGSALTLPGTLEDSLLWYAIDDGLSYFNSYPPTTILLTAGDGGSLDIADDGLDARKYRTPVLMGARFFALTELSIFEAGKHFQYNDNGISITRDRTSKYQQLATSIITPLNQLLALLKKDLALNSVRLKGQYSSYAFPDRGWLRGIRGTRFYNVSGRR